MNFLLSTEIGWNHLGNPGQWSFPQYLFVCRKVVKKSREHRPQNLPNMPKSRKRNVCAPHTMLLPNADLVICCKSQHAYACLLCLIPDPDFLSSQVWPRPGDLLVWTPGRASPRSRCAGDGSLSKARGAADSDQPLYGPCRLACSVLRPCL